MADPNAHALSWDGDDHDDSDDEFLTVRNDDDQHGEHATSVGGKNSIDREALVRKKLLESFYGKSAVAAAASASASHPSAGPLPFSSSSFDEDDDGDDEDSDLVKSELRKAQQQQPLKSEKNAPVSPMVLGVDDLDSPHFDARAHTERLVREAPIHVLLMEEERLALQVRTLDSTMQTMVYENYSRFIEATDAIRNIGVHVQANEHGLARLTAGMTKIDAISKHMEDTLGSLRDQVAEKIRVKRLLTRLDALLKLPQTLREQMAAGKYRTATRSYLSALSIFSKHSEGFESLKNIELECTAILATMKADLKSKLLHWSGGGAGGGFGAGNSSYLSTTLSSGEGGDEELLEHVPDPPKAMTEIFECAGTLYLLRLQQQRQAQHDANANNTMQDDYDDREDSHVEDDDLDELNITELKAMALSSSMRLLDRILDVHLIEVQERRFAAAVVDPLLLSPTNMAFRANAHSAAAGSTASSTLPAAGRHSSTLIPCKFLDAMVDCANLYRDCFADSDRSERYLLDFCSEAYSNFLAHVRSLLLEETIQQAQKEGGDESTFILSSEDAVDAYEDEGGDEEDAMDGSNSQRRRTHDSSSPPSGTFPQLGSHCKPADEISNALSTLVESVSDMAKGLSTFGMGDHGIFSGQIVEQAKRLTVSLVQRRVDQKFHDLRLHVVRDCLVPFAERAVVEKKNSSSSSHADRKTSSTLLQLVPVASSTLSNCFQLLDDAVRSILSGGSGFMFANLNLWSSNAPKLKDSVLASTHRFALWLASAFEMLASGETSHERNIVEASIEREPPAWHGVDTHLDGYSIHTSSSATARGAVADDVSDLVGADNNDAWLESMDTAVAILINFYEGEESSSISHGEIHEDFILAIAEMCRLAEGSVSEALEQSVSSHLRGGKRKSRGIFPAGHESPSKAGSVGGTEKDDLANRFRLAQSRVLVLYATKRGVAAGGILSLGLDDLAATSDSDFPGSPSPVTFEALAIAKQTAMECARMFGGSKRGAPLCAMEQDRLAGPSTTPGMSNRRSVLHMDVERIFKEKISIYPHPSELFEASRSSVLFVLFKVAFRCLLERVRMQPLPAQAYRQLLVDRTFLKFMIQHYVNTDYSMNNAGAGGAGPPSSGQVMLFSILDDLMDAAADRCPDDECTTLQNDEFKLGANNVVRQFIASSLIMMMDGTGAVAAASFIITDEDEAEE